MKVSKNKVVAVSYELQVEGKIADKAGSEAPLEYIHGTGMLLPKFEAALEGKEPGDSFAFTLTPSEGYGEHNPNYLANVPLAAFEVDGKLRDDLLKPGAVIPMLNGEGQVVQGTIVEIGKDIVKMDFNHPMAGKTLNFSGKVEKVREATDKELLEGLHGEYLPQEECHCHGKCKHHEDGQECECHGEHKEGHCGHHEGGCGHHEGGCCHHHEEN